MEKRTLKLPRLILVRSGFNKYNYLERLAFEDKSSKAILTFQEDSKEDSRIITIKYQIESDDPENHVMYYSETLNQHKFITANLGYGYFGRVFVRDKNNHRMNVSFEHLGKEGLRIKHVERIDKIENIREDLTPLYVLKRYMDFFYNLQKFS